MNQNFASTFVVYVFNDGMCLGRLEKLDFYAVLMAKGLERSSEL
jgi:hypothetical protein